MTTHLAHPRGILCHTEARWPARSGDLRDVTCKRCARRLVTLAAEESDALFERNRLATAARAAESLGAGFLWSLVADAATPTERLVRDVLAAVLQGIAEQHLATVEPAA